MKGFRFLGCWRGACPRWFCVALAVDADGEGMAGAFYSVVFLNVRPWAVNFSLSVSAMFAVMSAR